MAAAPGEPFCAIRHDVMHAGGFLVIGAADWHTTAWLDGAPLGTHQGGYTAFEFELTPHLRAGQAQRVPFDADHLRRVLINLLDNALRYASPAPDAIQVVTRSGPAAELAVWSDGAPLEAGVQRHLFEPFFSSESRSSGLGLYICRELCERHGAVIGYRRVTSPAAASREGNEFFVSLRAAAGSALDGGAPAATIGA